MGITFLQANPDAVSIDELNFHSPRRFTLLGEFRNTSDLYGFAPWFHLITAGKQEALASFVWQDKIFPSVQCLTIDIVGICSYQRQVMVNSADFNKVLSSNPSVSISEGLVPLWFFMFRKKWSTTFHDGQSLPTGIETWQLRYKF